MLYNLLQHQFLKTDTQIIILHMMRLMMSFIFQCFLAMWSDQCFSKVSEAHDAMKSGILCSKVKSFLPLGIYVDYLRKPDVHFQSTSNIYYLIQFVVKHILFYQICWLQVKSILDIYYFIQFVGFQLSPYQIEIILFSLLASSEVHIKYILFHSVCWLQVKSISKTFVHII